MPQHQGPLSGPRWNMLRDEIVAWYRQMVDYYVERLIEDGYPPFTEPRSEREQYDTLVAWYMAGDPRFWDDPQANAALSQLEMRYGPRPNLTPYNAPYPRIG